MGTRKNENRSKSAIDANGHFGTYGDWGKWGLGENGHQKKRAPEQMGIGQLGVNEQFGQMGVWDQWACGNWDKWMFGEMGTLGQMGT